MCCHDLHVNISVTITSAFLLHWQVNVDYDEVEERIQTGQYRPAPNDQVLKPMNIISNVWKQPHGDELHVFVSVPDRSTRSVSQPIDFCEYYPYPYSLHSHWRQCTHLREARRSQHYTKGSGCILLSWYCYGVGYSQQRFLILCRFTAPPQVARRLFHFYLRTISMSKNQGWMSLWCLGGLRRRLIGGWLETVSSENLELGTKQENHFYL